MCYLVRKASWRTTGVCGTGGEAGSPGGGQGACGRGRGDAGPGGSGGGGEGGGVSWRVTLIAGVHVLR